MTTIAAEAARRRTFAIICHPDAGKTTLTEKLLLFGGAIQLAGAVKARGDARRARSDWMKVEQERGISVTASVMTFDYGGCTFNLLDTPGHEDFSEDTYRTLTAVDSAVMVIDAAKGIETQTRKLFEVCRLRDVPIITFINKLDREGRDPFELMDEIEQRPPAPRHAGELADRHGRRRSSAATTCCATGCCCSTAARERAGSRARPATASTIPSSSELLPARRGREAARGGRRWLRGLCPAFDLETYREGHLTPVFFGSALNNFGVRELLDGAGRAGAVAAARSGRRARGRPGRGAGHRLRLQDPGEHGPASTATASPSCASARAASSAA